MPRQKTLAVEDALDFAMDVFAELGYQDAGIAEIARRVLVSRSTVYATVGDVAAFEPSPASRTIRLSPRSFCHSATAEPYTTVSIT